MKPSSNPTQPIPFTEPDPKAALLGFVRDSFAPVSFGLGWLYVLFSVAHYFLLPPGIKLIMSVVAGVSALMLFGIRYLVGRFKVPLNWTNFVAASIVLIALFNSFLHMYLTADPLQTTNIILLIVGTGMIFLSYRWFISITVIISAVWIAAVVAIGESPLWVHFSFAMVGGITLAVLIHRVRYNVLSRLVEARTRQLRFTTQLSTVAHTARRLNRILDSDQLLSFAVQTVASQFDLQVVHIYRLDEDSESLELQAGNHKKDIPAKNWLQPLSQSDNPLVQTVTQRQPILIQRTSDGSSAEQAILLPNMSVALLVPLMTQGRVLGVLDIQTAESTYFSRNQLDIFSTLAQNIATALENARLVDELRHTTHVAKEASEAKSNFLARMSHELRTPLNAIIGYSALLIDHPDAPGYAEFAPDVKKIYQSGDHLLSLINRILDFSKMEAGEMTLVLEEIPVNSFIQNIIPSVQPLMLENNNTFVFNPGPATTIYADLNKLRQILLNLLNNAAKFTQNGRITLNIYQLDSLADLQHIAPDTINLATLKTSLTAPPYLVFAVEDTGIGIAPENYAQLFQAFKQISNLYTREADGAGLGLVLTQQLCHLMGGEIGLESEVGVGSTFSVYIPKQVRDASAQN